MRFKLKELVIQIVPEEEIGHGWLPEGSCGAGPTCTVTCVYCSDAPSACRIHGSVPAYCFDSGAVDPNPLKRLESLAVLKAQLQEHIAALEAVERSTKASLEPKTRAQIETIERHLEQALQEVRSRKAKLDAGPDRATKTRKKPSA